MSRSSVGRPKARRVSDADWCCAVLGAVDMLERRCLLSSIATFPIPGQSGETFSWSGSAHIATGPDGNLWFTDPGNNQVDRVTSQGQITPFSLPEWIVTTGGATAGATTGSGGSGTGAVPGSQDPSPDDIVSGPDGNLWFTESGVDRIGRITPGGTITEYTTPTTDSNPTGIAVGSDGNLWFTESGTNQIGRITPAGTITEFSTKNLDLSSTDKMVEGPGGDVWFVAFDSDGNNEVARVNTAGKVTAYALNSYPTDLTVGPDGNLYVAAQGEIDRIDATGKPAGFTIPDGSDAYAITAGPDGAIWFGSDGVNQLERMTTGGTFQAFSLPEPGATDGSTVSFGALTSGPDGNLWFTDDQMPQVGSINVTNALLAGSASAMVTAGATSTQTLASFVDLAGGGTASQYSATITWPDGSTTAGTIAANSAGGFDVSVSRDWSLNDDSAKVAVTDTRNTARTATAMADIIVNLPHATGTGVSVTSTAGQLFSGTVATFTGVALNSLSSYSATIDWGDGQVSNGTLAANNSGGVDVSGSTRFPASGTYTMRVTLSPWPGGFLYPLGGGAGIEPVALGAPAAQVRGPAATALHNRILAHELQFLPHGIRPSTLTIKTAKAATAARAAVSVEPLIPVDPLPPLWSGYGTASSTMTVAPGVMDGTGFTIQASSTTPFSGTVASFKLADPNADLSHLHATVTWSDDQVFDWFTCGTAPTTGTLTPDGQGGFTVSVSGVNFASFGLSHFTVSISDDRITSGDATVGVAYGQLCVDSPIRWLPILKSNGANAPTGASSSAAASAASTAASNVNPALSEQVTVTPTALKPGPGGNVAGTVGVLSGVTPATKNLADLHGTIHWGDGTTSPARLVRGARGKVLVRGSHHFAQSGSFDVSVDAQQTLYEKGKPSALYPMELPAIQTTATVVPHRPIRTGGVAIAATAGQPFSGTLAAFTAPDLGMAVTRAAAVFWGDGTRSAGTIAANGNDLTISGTHTWRRAGSYHVRVVVTQKVVQRGSRVPFLVANILTTATVTTS